MNEEIVKVIVKDMNDEFDSHDFIKEFIWRHPKDYGELLIKHENVTRAHAEISNFLLNHANSLGIKKTKEDGSDDIFGHVTPCAEWKKQ